MELKIVDYQYKKKVVSYALPICTGDIVIGN